jgi:hypothetical protein
LPGAGDKMENCAVAVPFTGAPASLRLEAK